MPDRRQTANRRRRQGCSRRISISWRSITAGPTRGCTTRRPSCRMHARKRPIGLFFGSLHGTLNHLLVTDYIWLRRMTGEGPQPERLDQVLHEDFDELRAAREAANARVFDFVTGLAPADYDRALEYRNSTGKLFQQRLGLGADAFVQSSDPPSRTGPCGPDDPGRARAGLARPSGTATVSVIGITVRSRRTSVMVSTPSSRPPRSCSPVTPQRDHRR